MGLRGPAPTPTKVLKMRGTYRPHRHAGSELVASPLAKAPKPPKHLSDTARALWKKIAPMLVADELLAAKDLGAFEGYIVIYARAIDAEAVVAVEGRTVPSQQGLKRHPELVTAEKARADMRKYEQLFGLSPSDRARLRLPTAKKPTVKDPWDEVASG